MDITKQYNNFSDKFSELQDQGENSNNQNRKNFYSYLDFIKPGMKVLDLACGDGLDLMYYKSLGADIYGLDASENFIKMSQEKNPEAKLTLGLMEKIPFPDNTFDVVLSKYAIQTSPDLKPIFSEIQRILKPGGTMVYLVVHPFRQYFEKKNLQADYFKQEIVDSNIFNNTLTVKEPTHTLNEYLNDFLFSSFDVKQYQEYWEPAAEQIDNKKYPGYFILKAVKR